MEIQWKGDPSSDYDAERYCDHCDADTPHRCHDAGHERDSSHDWAKCLVCGWRYSGMTGRYEPPSGRVPG
jgi:hypothetical protein